MRLILDSHTLLWVVFEHTKLSLETQRAIGSVDNIVYVSIVSLWEIGIKNKRGVSV